MLRIIHGENVVQSRNELAKIIDQSRQNNQKVLRFEAKSLTLAELEQALGSTSLFGDNESIILEGLHSLPKSKKKDALISLVSNNSTSSNLDVILWEKRSLTTTMLKKFPHSREMLFKLTNQLFKWLDMISPENKTKMAQLKVFHQALEDNGEQMCFMMLVRQIRLLIQTKDGGRTKGAPFMISKLKKQAQGFSLEKLLSVYAHLLDLDIGMKTSKNALSLGQSLDLLLINL